jgi:hypothetical protein
MGLNPDDLADDPTTTEQPTGQQSRELPPMTLESTHAELSRTRSEAAKFRTQNRDLRKLLSSVSGEEVPEGSHPPDLATLQSRFAHLTAGDKAAIVGLKLDLGLERASRKHGVERPSVLKAFLADGGKLTGLDPAAETFESDLSDLIAETLENAPELRGRSAMPPGGTGAQFRPGPTSQQITRGDLAHMTSSEIAEAHKTGKLDALLGRSS